MALEEQPAVIHLVTQPPVGQRAEDSGLARKAQGGLCFRRSEQDDVCFSALSHRPVRGCTAHTGRGCGPPSPGTQLFPGAQGLLQTIYPESLSTVPSRAALLHTALSPDSLQRRSALLRKASQCSSAGTDPLLLRVLTIPYISNNASVGTNSLFGSASRSSASFS